jgi:hypothetical protein
MYETFVRLVACGIEPAKAYEQAGFAAPGARRGQLDLVKRSNIDLWKAFRYGLKLLAKNPAFTATAVLTIAFGIGPNTAIFCAMYTVFWAPSDDPSNGRILVVRFRFVAHEDPN